MTLQERMVAVYLRQANLSPEEKGKLRLFLGLLLETMEEEEEWEKEPSSAPAGHLPAEGEGFRAEQSRAEQSRAEQSRAEQSRAEQSRAEQPRRQRRQLPLAWIQLGLQTVHPKAAVEKKEKRRTLTL